MSTKDLIEFLKGFNPNAVIMVNDNIELLKNHIGWTDGTDETDADSSKKKTNMIILNALPPEE